MITRQEFIYDFMVKTTRPVSELQEFLNDFDGKPKVTKATQEPKKTQEPKEKRVIHVSSPLTKAKYIQIWMDEREKKTYATQRAVAKALGVSQSSVCYALKNGTKINNYHIKLVKQPFDFSQND